MTSKTTGYETVGTAHAALTRGYLTEPDVSEVIAATSTDGLLTAFAALTHRMDALRTSRRREGVDQARADLRAQRDLIRAEVLRRTGDL